jgi:hypothetical protein
MSLSCATESEPSCICAGLLDLAKPAQNIYQYHQAKKSRYQYHSHNAIPGITEDTRFYIPKKNMAEPDLLIKNTQRKGHGTEEIPAD